MLVYRPTTSAPLARYYYLPATDAKPAEIIQVINSRGITVEVPLREEDAVLTSFFERRLTPEEQEAFQDRESWAVFVAWEEMEQDHLRFGVAEEDWLLLMRFKTRYTLKEGIAV